MTWIFLIIYLVIFVWWFRDRYRHYRNFNEQRINRKMSRPYGPTEWIHSDTELQMGALTMALFWPVTIPVRGVLDLITRGVRTDGEEAQRMREREQAVRAQEAKDKRAKADFKAKAKELNIPGWELL